jgi:hypothetical protein
MQQKYGTVYVHYKPIILAEFAAAAQTGCQATWVAAALTDTRIYWDCLPAPGFRTFWTLTRFLSRTPIRDTFGVVETPTTSSMMLQGQTESAPSPTPKTDAGALNQQDAPPTPK